MIEIWCEGDPRHDFTACHLGTAKGSTLLEACEDLARHNPYFDAHFRKTSMTYKGCKLFSNETAARESHG